VVTVNSLPAAPAISSNSPLCAGDTLQLTATGGGGLIYLWSGPNGFSSTLQNPTIPNVSEADNQGTYTLQVQNAAGCLSVAVSLFVEITASPQTPSLSSNSPVCVGDDIVLTSNTIAGATAYIWTRPAGTDTTTTGPQLIIANSTVADSGAYAVRVVAGGCPSPPATAVVNVLGGSLAIVAGNNGPICEGQDIELTATAIVGAIYNWTGPNGFTSSTQNPVITAATLADAGAYTVTVTVAGCATSVPSSTTVDITPSPLVAGVLNNGPLCQGEDLELTAPTISGVTYSWTGPNGFTSTLQNPTILSVNENDHQGMYTLIVTDTLTGCASLPVSTMVFIDSQGSLVIITSNDGPVCEGGDVQLNVTVSGGTPPYTYLWAGPGGFTSTLQNPVITNLTAAQAGVYSVLVNGLSGACSAGGSSNSTTVAVNQGLAVDAGPDITITQGESAQLLATGAFVYTWQPTTYLSNPSVANPVATPPVGTFAYIVSGIDLNGCEGADTVNVIVEPQTGLVGVYDLFTPNGDGVNDFWVVEFLSNFTNYQLVVFDRGGVEVLSTNNYQNDWDGTYRGRDLPEGTYWYVIRTPEREFKGAITLIR
jgi:gliding motility-associated-like protein